ncbi:MAG TPA: transposase, partial [Candidatus Synoicihabitans sp.]|nr:transposase [Candidatus Synoicihabitans sp.]
SGCGLVARSQMLTQGRRERGQWWRPKAWARLRPSLPAWQAALLANLQAQATLLHQQIQALDEQIAELARAKKVQDPRGIGALTWMTLLLEMLEWERFKNRRQVASYTGLCPGEHSSGARLLELSIDKHGNRRVRHVLIEAAWRLLLWQPDYPPLQKLRAASGSRARKRAVVAVARHLAIDLWRLATGRTTPDKVGLDACDPRLCAAPTAAA